MPKLANAKTAWAPKLLVVAILLAVPLALLVADSPSKVCQEKYSHDKTIRVGQETLKAQSALSSGELERGLSGRQCLGADQGMLFIFDKSDYYSFWMKNMRFNIDMIWLSDSKKVVHLEKNVSPDSFPQSFTSSKPAQYVLELPAGSVDRLNLVSGTQLSY